MVSQRGRLRGGEDRGRVRGVNRFVVGVDGSPTSREALRWAIDLATTTGVTVDVIGAWSHPANFEWTVRTTNYGLITVPELPTAEHIKSAVRSSLADMVAELDSQGATVTQHVVEGHPADVLVEAAKDADLLVLGRRGHGRVAEVLLGSVSQHCIQHAPCPVVVVPVHEPDES
jgi:nucleotide-binding universal stress UspA family protein